VKGIIGDYKKEEEAPAKQQQADKTKHGANR
jgi:hypothetical protein